MINNPNQQITLSLNKHRFLTREAQKNYDGRYNDWERAKIQIRQLEEYIRGGYAFAGVFRNNTRLQKNFEYTHIIGLDVDNGTVPLKDFLNGLAYAPTVSYTTVSDQRIPGVYRYRLLYVFDTPIADDNDYWILYNQIKNLNCVNPGDDCPEANNQFFYGNATDACYYHCSDIIYSPEDFDLSACQRQGLKRPEKEKKDICPELEKWYSKTKKLYPYKNLGPGIVWDLERMSYEEFVEAYKNEKGVKLIFQDKLTYDDKGRARRPENFIEIFYPPRFSKINGELMMEQPKISNGFKRRKHIFYDAVRIRLIKPNVWNESLAYNVVRNMLKYIDWNVKEDPITKREIIDLINRALCVDITNPEVREYLKSSRAGTCCADKSFCKANGLNATVVARSLQFEERYDWIESWYNPFLTVKENHKKQPTEPNNYYNKPISLSTLITFCKKRGFSTNPKPKVDCIFRDGMSAKLCYEQIQKLDLPISQASVYVFYKNKGISTKTGLKKLDI